MAAKRFEWDEAKAASNLVKHGVPFKVATAVFLDPAVADFDASQADQGELRRKAVGSIGGRLFTLVYTLRDGAVRIVSARRANEMEKRRYDEARSLHARSE